MENNVTADPQYRALTTRLLTEVGDELEVDVAAVEYGDRDRDASESWIVYVVDPSAASREAPLTDRSARDHFRLGDNTNFSQHAGEHLRLRVYEIVTSNGAAMPMVGDDGRVTQYLPFAAGLALARATFNYWPV